jgi:ubiquinol-cytochrome c reductase iron-sulfur subunit
LKKCWSFVVANIEEDEGTRRDFLFYATGGAAAVGTGAAVWPLINQMNPSADVS